ncbi:MAG: hypothetical protein KF745_09595 [Phycisphaeraceae bacterium]|nr:hypothetical protein [Phycisphaeraceae bacterium]
MIRCLLAASVLGLSLTAASALAQPGKATGKTAPAKPASTPADPTSDGSALKGPAVTAAAVAPTLVQRDFSGKVVRLETNPAEAAVRVMPLDAASRAAVDRILLERSRLLDQLVTENLQTISLLHNAREAGDKAEATRLVQELAAKAKPLRDRGVLAQELIAALPPDEGKELKRMVQEYWKAVVDEDLAKPASEREDKSPGATRMAGVRDSARTEFARIAGQEIKSAYERTIGQQSRDFDALIAQLSLTPAQESKVRKIVGDSFNKSFGKATPNERAQVFWKVYAELDETQKKQILERIGGPHAHGGSK